jgi:hypothetical protein
VKQFAGWTPRSNTHYKYVHFRGNESQDDLLKAKGIIKDDKHSVSILQSKTCPNCREPNKSDAQFCFKCNFVMSFESVKTLFLIRVSKHVLQDNKGSRNRAEI